MRRTILVDNETGEPLAVGDMVKLLATPAAELIHISYPGDEGLEGRVHLRNKGAHADRIFFPSTIGAHFVEKA